MPLKNVLITGATSGIGKITAFELAQKGYHVIIHGRNESKAKMIVQTIKNRIPHSQVSYVIADLFSLASVQRMTNQIIAQYDHLDVLINNAGAVLDDQRKENANGIELIMQLNLMAPFLLTQLLLPQLEKSADVRIINMSSATAKIVKPNLHDLNLKRITSGQKRYGISKLFVIWNTQSLARVLKQHRITNVSVNASHPGAVATNFGQNSDNGFWNNLIYKVALKLHLMASPQQGAATNIYLATSSKVKNVSGKFFNNKQKVTHIPKNNTLRHDEQILWDYCMLTVKPFLNKAD